jgi:hypothetical protein
LAYTFTKWQTVLESGSLDGSARFFVVPNKLTDETAQIVRCCLLSDCRLAPDRHVGLHEANSQKCVHRHKHVKAQRCTQQIDATGISGFQRCCIVHLAAATFKSCQYVSDTCHVRRPRADQARFPISDAAQCACEEKHANVIRHMQVPLHMLIPVQQLPCSARHSSMACCTMATVKAGPRPGGPLEKAFNLLMT